MTTRLLILQTTPFCNIDCSYCYLPDRSGRRQISPEVVASACDLLAEAGLVADGLSVVWHAGEPLAVGAPALDRLVGSTRRLEAAGFKINHCVQTNGTLISDAFCDLFERIGMRVGVSIDGPQDLHDLNRKMRNGRGTFGQVMRGIDRLRARGIGFDAICVLSDAALDRAEEIYDFFAGLGARSLGFNVPEIEGQNRTSDISSDAYLGRLRQFWNRLIGHHFGRRALYLREIDDLVASLRYGEMGRLSELVQPFGIVTVACDGSIYTFSPELAGQSDRRFDDFSIGNVSTDSFEHIRANDRLLRMKAEIDLGIERCRNGCAYFDVCGGGAPSNKIAEHGRFDVAETRHCKSTKQALVDSLLSYVDRPVAA